MSDKITAERLKSLGLTKVAGTIEKKLDIKRRAAIAYEFYRVASEDVIKEFCGRMKERTLKIQTTCPKCEGKGKEELFYSKDKGRLKTMIDRAKKSKLKASNCGYCRGTGAQGQTYDTLRFTALKDYDKVPPEACLAQLEVAVKRECFDEFEVADVETVMERPDPIIFGRIKGSSDRFFVTQWDNDIDINDILGNK